MTEDSQKGLIGTILDKFRQLFGSASARVEPVVQEVAAEARGVADSIAATSSELAAEAREKVNEAVDKAASVTEDIVVTLKESAPEILERTRETLTDVVEEVRASPVVAGAMEKLEEARTTVAGVVDIAGETAAALASEAKDDLTGIRQVVEQAAEQARAGVVELGGQISSRAQELVAEVRQDVAEIRQTLEREPDKIAATAATGHAASGESVAPDVASSPAPDVGAEPDRETGA